MCLTLSTWRIQGNWKGVIVAKKDNNGGVWIPDVFDTHMRRIVLVVQRFKHRLSEDMEKMSKRDQNERAKKSPHLILTFVIQLKLQVTKKELQG